MKLPQRKHKKTDVPAEAPSTRITNETVAEHREQVLAGGRKFKYPLQYQKHKLIINSVLIGIAAVVVLGLLCWQQLYLAQNSSQLIYRLTQIVPVPVASVDGATVRYSDYLMRYKSSLYYLQQQNDVNINTKDGQRQAEFVKREELDKAEMMAYVHKLADQNKLKVTADEVDAFIQKDIDARSVSLNAYEKTVLKSFYDWTLSEYKDVVRDELLKRKVSFAIDTTASDTIKELYEQVKNGADMATVASQSSDDEATKGGGGDSGTMSLQNQDSNGLIAAARELDNDQLSDIIRGVDGYYFIKLINKDASSVQYRVVKVSLKELDKQFEQLQKDGKIREYISVSREES